jgi:hypothetical protein
MDMTCKVQNTGLFKMYKYFICNKIKLIITEKSTELNKQPNVKFTIQKQLHNSTKKHLDLLMHSGEKQI